MSPSRYSLLALLLLAACGDGTGPSVAVARTPAAAVFVTDDADRYFRAYDAGGRSGSTTVFQTRYLDSATVGLQDMVRSRSITAASLAQVALAYPRYLDAVGAWWRSAGNQRAVFETVRANYARLATLYPDAVFPPVTILVGRYSTGGTIGNSGLLIGLEFFGVDAAAPTTELGVFARNNQKSWQRDLPTLIAHEHTHFLSSRAGSTATRSGAPLLSVALSEGIAEFIGELASGQPTFLAFYREWQSRELEFWQAFDREKGGTDLSRWLYNQGQTAANWPGDLGYFMGYRIAQAYYAKATDKTQAVRELIALRDPAALLTQSGYAGAGPPIQ